MIKIDRNTSPQRTLFDSRKNKCLNMIQNSINKGIFTSKCIYPLWKDKKIKDFLHEEQNGKCCYCERKRDPRRETDIEHFRPKSEVVENKQHNGYWWLSYEWNNLLISCKTCNEQFKKNHFPLNDESKRVYDQNGDLNQESPMLINPLIENPADSIEYDIPDTVKDDDLMIKAIGRNERGNKTIELTGLNSKEVMMERMEKFKLLMDLIKLKIGKESIENYIKPNVEFSGFSQEVFKKKNLL